MTAIDLAFLTAFTALISAIIGPLTTLRIGRAQIRANLISANRQKWIDQFRTRIASFSSQAVVVSLIRDRMIEEGRFVSALDPDIVERIQNLVETFETIRLLVNPVEQDQQILTGKLRHILDTLRRAPRASDLEHDIEAEIEDVVEMTQAVLKREWVRVKRGR